MPNTDKEKRAEWHREYFIENKDSINSKRRDRYSPHPRTTVDDELKKERARLAAARYREKHPEKIKAYKQRPETKARAAERMREARPNFTDEQKERARIGLRKSHLKRLYGITPDQYDSMLTAQGGVCAICKKEDKNKRWNGRLHVDHCHKTGAVRSLLCTACNITLGRIDESIETAMAIVKYLQHYNVRVFQ